MVQSSPSTPSTPTIHSLAAFCQSPSPPLILPYHWRNIFARLKAWQDSDQMSLYLKHCWVMLPFQIPRVSTFMIILAQARHLMSPWLWQSGLLKLRNDQVVLIHRWRSWAKNQIHRRSATVHITFLLSFSVLIIFSILPSVQWRWRSELNNSLWQKWYILGSHRYLIHSATLHCGLLKVTHRESQRHLVPEDLIVWGPQWWNPWRALTNHPFLQRHFRVAWKMSH